MIGKLIIFEGIDGAGKNTLIDKLLEKINNKNQDKSTTPLWLHKEIFSTFEPTNDSLAALKIKEHLKNSATKNNDLLIQWFIADRIKHTKKIKQKLLNYNVFCNRYDLSTYAYQASEENSLKDFKGIYDQHRYASFAKLSSGSLIPDITFFFQLDITLALERIEKRNQGKEYYEKKEKLIKIQNCYLKAINFLQEKDKRKIFIVDANKSPTNIVQLMLAIFNQEM